MAKKPSNSDGNARSAKTGKFVTQEYAKKHPSTTVVESKPGGSKPGKKSK
jgi:hypothetical protein